MPVAHERVAMTQPAPVPTPPAVPAPTDPTPPAPTPAPVPAVPVPASGDPTPNVSDLGDEGQKAIQIQRQRARTAEALIAEMAGMSKTQVKAMLDKALDVEQKKTELELLNEKFAGYEKDLQSEREARWRAEVAAEKGLTAQQASRLKGSTREELTTDADDLLALFPATPAGPRTPAPDPSQGARGGQPGADLEAQIAEAQKNGNWQSVIALKRQKTFQ